MSKENPKIEGALRVVFDNATSDSEKNNCTELFIESVIYHSIQYVLSDKGAAKGTEVTWKIVSKLKPAKVSKFVDSLRKLAAEKLDAMKLNSELIVPDSVTISKDLEGQLFRIRKFKEIGLSYTNFYTVDEFINSVLFDETEEYCILLKDYGFTRDEYVSWTVEQQLSDVFDGKSDKPFREGNSFDALGKMFEEMLGINPFAPTSGDKKDETKTGNSSSDKKDEYNSSDFEKAGEVDAIHTKKIDPNSATPALDEFGINMTELARDGKYDNVIGREKEVRQIIEILCCRKKNNAIVIGKAGAGKTALIEYLAQLIVADKVPTELKGKRIINLSTTTLTAGCIYRGQLEQRIQDVCKEAAQNKDVILVIDEFHSAVSEGSSDISQMLKPGLSRGELTLIAMTTYDEYKKYIEKDGALKRRFQKVYVEEPEPDETFEILQGLREKYSGYHNVEYSDEVLRKCVEWSAKYMYDRNSPDRAIDLMDVSGSRAKLDRPSDSTKVKALEEKIKRVEEKKVGYVKKEKYEEAQKERERQQELELRLEELKASRKKTQVTLEDVAAVVSELTNIPLEKIMNPDIEKLRNMSTLLKDKIIGQDEGIEAVTKLLSKQFLGLRNENVPPSLYISGGTGTGKTYLAEEIAKSIFGTEKAMLRIDCGELSQPHTVTKLIGAPPSYVGFGETALFDKVRERPQQLILIDEADKLNDEILNTIFLNILTTGFITLSNGIEVSFKDCIFIFTSNDGTRDLEAHGKGIGFGLEDKKTVTKDIVMKAIKRRIRPEVINRFSGIVIFNNLSVEDMKKIYTLELEKVQKRLEKKGLSLKVSYAVRDKIISELDLNYGARDLSRGIAKWVEDKICDKILEEDVSKKHKVEVDLKDEDVVVKFKK